LNQLFGIQVEVIGAAVDYGDYGLFFETGTHKFDYGTVS
jgi:hypothetical protein